MVVKLDQKVSKNGHCPPIMLFETAEQGVISGLRQSVG